MVADGPEHAGIFAGAEAGVVELGKDRVELAGDLLGLALDPGLI